MSNEIKPIETIYNGYKFRSRAEARWAIFFDEMGIKYVYESEGLNIDGVFYLPDFYLPESKSFFEVKGIMSDKDQEKIDALVKAGYSVTVGYSDFTFEACTNNAIYWGGDDDFSQGEAVSSVLAKCHKCEKYWFMDYAGAWECQCCGHYEGNNGFYEYAYGEQLNLWNEEAILALNKAKQARFEHGENPTKEVTTWDRL